jgi:hypothetical protein
MTPASEPLPGPAPTARALPLELLLAHADELAVTIA